MWYHLTKPSGPNHKFISKWVSTSHLPSEHLFLLKAKNKLKELLESSQSTAMLNAFIQKHVFAHLFKNKTKPQHWPVVPVTRFQAFHDSQCHPHFYAIVTAVMLQPGQISLMCHSRLSSAHFGIKYVILNFRKKLQV